MNCWPAMLVIEKRFATWHWAQRYQRLAPVGEYAI